MEREKKVSNDMYKLLKNKLKEYKYMQNRILEREEIILTEREKDCNSYIKSNNMRNSAVENNAIRLIEDELLTQLKAWKRNIDDLLIYYIKDKAKYEFIKRRYIDRSLRNYNIKNSDKIKDKDVIRDMEFDGFQLTGRTYIRYKNEILYNLYLLVKEDKCLKKYLK